MEIASVLLSSWPHIHRLGGFLDESSTKVALRSKRHFLSALPSLLQTGLQEFDKWSQKCFYKQLHTHTLTHTHTHTQIQKIK